MRQITENIDFNKIAAETGVRKGRIFHSPTWGSWVIEGHPDINLICIEAPHKIGDKLKGKTVDSVKIVDNQWVIKIV
jgi:hypothetical protein